MSKYDSYLQKLEARNPGAADRAMTNMTHDQVRWFHETLKEQLGQKTAMKEEDRKKAVAKAKAEHKPGEYCTHCGAVMEGNDDGSCNSCSKKGTYKTSSVSSLRALAKYYPKLFKALKLKRTVGNTVEGGLAGAMLGEIPALGAAGLRAALEGDNGNMFQTGGAAYGGVVGYGAGLGASNAFGGMGLRRAGRLPLAGSIIGALTGGAAGTVLDNKTSRCWEGTYKTSGFGNSLTNVALTGAGGMMGAGAGIAPGALAGSAGGTGAAILADLISRHRGGRGIRHDTVRKLITGATGLGTALGVGTGAVVGGTLGNRFAKATQNAAEAKPKKDDNDKTSNVKMANLAARVLKIKGLPEIAGLTGLGAATAAGIAATRKNQSQAPQTDLQATNGTKFTDKVRKGLSARNQALQDVTGPKKDSMERSKLAFGKLLMSGGAKLMGKLRGVGSKAMTGAVNKVPGARKAVDFSKRRPIAATAIGGAATGAGGAGAGWLSADTDPVDVATRQVSGLPEGYGNPAMNTPAAAYSNKALNVLPPVAAYRWMRAKFDPAYAEYRGAVTDATRETPEAIQRSAKRVFANNRQDLASNVRSLRQQDFDQRRAIMAKYMKLRNSYDPRKQPVFVGENNPVNRAYDAVQQTPIVGSILPISAKQKYLEEKEQYEKMREKMKEISAQYGALHRPRI